MNEKPTTYADETELRKAGFIPCGEVVRLFRDRGCKAGNLDRLIRTGKLTVASILKRGAKNARHWVKPREVEKHYPETGKLAKKAKKAAKPVPVKITVTYPDQSR